MHYGSRCRPGVVHGPSRRGRSVALAFVLVACAAPASAQTESNEATPSSHWSERAEVSPESLVVIDGGIALGANLIGFGLFAASFEIDAASCNATGSTNCGIAGVAVGGALWLAMQMAIGPLMSNLFSQWAGAPFDEGWSYGGSAIATFASFAAGGLAAYLALFPAEGDVLTGIAVGVATITIVQAALSALIRELTRPGS